MNQQIPQQSGAEIRLVLLFLAQKFGLRALRWGFCLFLGLLFWVLFDPLPPLFFWVAIVIMVGSMSIHSVLHQQGGASSFAKQVCRYAFFYSFPMLLMFVGNRIAVWSVSEDNLAVEIPTGIPKVQGVIATEEYLLFKEIQKEGFKDPVKSKKGFKKFLGKSLAKAKKMDEATKIILIVLGAILLLVIIFLIAVVYAVNDSVDSCAGSSTTTSDSCCMA